MKGIVILTLQSNILNTEKFNFQGPIHGIFGTGIFRTILVKMFVVHVWDGTDLLYTSLLYFFLFLYQNDIQNTKIYIHKRLGNFDINRYGSISDSSLQKTQIRIKPKSQNSFGSARYCIKWAKAFWTCSMHSLDR